MNDSALLGRTSAILLVQKSCLLSVEYGIRLILLA